MQSGKTWLTQKILKELMSCVEGPIAVLDLAPERTFGLGGKLDLPSRQERINYFSPLIIPPRLTGRSEEEIWQIAKQNFRKIEENLRSIEEQAWSLLVINDVTIYLHHGTAEILMEKIKKAETLLLNGYFGRHFGRSAFSIREQQEMFRLLLLCDQILFIPSRRVSL